MNANNLLQTLIFIVVLLAAAVPVARYLSAVMDGSSRVVRVFGPLERAMYRIAGVDAGSGEVEGEAVRAAVTATFHGPKLGLYVNPGKEHAGRVEVVEIGVPRGAPGARDGLISERVLDLYPRRTPAGSKFVSGVLVVVGGSRGLTGAPCMSALAAMRAGAGYVTLVAPASLEAAFGARPLEAMLAGMPDADGALAPAAAEPVLRAVIRADAVVLGPGIGRAPGSDGATFRALRRDLVGGHVAAIGVAVLNHLMRDGGMTPRALELEHRVAVPIEA